MSDTDRPQCQPVCSEQRNQDIIRIARQDHRVNEELEIDDDNVKVSEGDDNGAWVSCWMWVDFSGTPLSKEQA